MGEAERRKVDFAKGYLLGLAGMPVATAPTQASEPLRMYNGHALPPLPEWDRETYPYAVITFKRGDRTKYRLIAYKSDNLYFRTGFGSTIYHHFGTRDSNTALVFTSSLGETSWSQETATFWFFSVDRDGGSSANGDDVAIWTHGFDLMYSDDTLYVGASEPERITDWDALKGKCFYNDVVLPDRKSVV